MLQTERMAERPSPNGNIVLMAGTQSADFLIIGAGCVGLRIAIELKKRYSDCRVVVIDKESELAAHASGRNSGVIHAGFYYPGDTLKAKLCAEGNRELTQYCRERKLKINQCGKLVAAVKEADIEGLRVLEQRAEQNGVALSPVDPEYAKKIEPNANCRFGGLYSPTTSTVVPAEVMAAYFDEANELGVDINLGKAYLRKDGDEIKTSQGSFSCGYVVNAAGLHADSIAKSFGFAKDYAILPFRGVYLYAEKPLPIRTNIYPVPDLRNPFLGVHITIAADGRTKLGPTAMPCLWREQYGGGQGFRIAELLKISGIALPLLISGAFNLRSLAYRESRKQFKHIMVREATHLAPIVEQASYSWGRPGIRAQLVDRKAKSLVMDFKIEGDGSSMHVLNAVSPAFTCAIPFARHVADEIDSRLQRG